MSRLSKLKESKKQYLPANLPIVKFSEKVVESPVSSYKNEKAFQPTVKVGHGQFNTNVSPRQQMRSINME